MSEETFKPGDLVKLKSGGSIMTVDTIGDDGVRCVWQNDGSTQYQVFGKAVLKIYEKPQRSAAIPGNPRTNWTGR